MAGGGPLGQQALRDLGCHLYIWHGSVPVGRLRDTEVAEQLVQSVGGQPPHGPPGHLQSVQERHGSKDGAVLPLACNEPGFGRGVLCNQTVWGRRQASIEIAEHRGCRCGSAERSLGDPMDHVALGHRHVGGYRRVV